MSELNIPSRLIHYRMIKGYTQKELANLARINCTQLSHFETGNRCPTIYNLIKLALALNVSIQALLE